jgi:hypothetical protein
VAEAVGKGGGEEAGRQRAAQALKAGIPLETHDVQGSTQDVQGRPVYPLGNGQWNIPELRALLEEIVPQHTVMDAYEVEQDFAGIGRRSCC